MSRSYPHRPMIGVGAVVLRQGRVLLVRRAREPARGKWSLPGGLVELGESVGQAVRREVYEESGLHVEVGDLIAVLDRVILDTEERIQYHYVLLDFLCTSHRGTPRAADDALDCVFVSLEKLSGFTLTAGTEEVIRRARLWSPGRPVPVYDPSL